MGGCKELLQRAVRRCVDFNSSGVEEADGSQRFRGGKGTLNRIIVSSQKNRPHLSNWSNRLDVWLKYSGTLFIKAPIAPKRGFLRRTTGTSAQIDPKGIGASGVRLCWELEEPTRVTGPDVSCAQSWLSSRGACCRRWSKATQGKFRLSHMIRLVLVYISFHIWSLNCTKQ